MSRIHLNKEQLEDITNILHRKGVVVGYLFGSYVRGTAGALSDIDIGVVFSKDMSKEEQDGRIEDIRGGLERMFGRDKVDIVNIPFIKNPLLRYIITLGEGKVIFSEDKALQNTLADQALREYEDTKNLRFVQGQALGGLFA
jgi:predicted nucleotidyltransferase